MAFKCKINKDNFMSKFHNEAPSVAKMVSPGSGYFDKTEPKKTSYADAYKKRDMKTYGDLSLEEYTAEAKRQNKSKKETGKWDAPKKPMKSSTKKEEVKEATPEVKKSQVKEVVEKKPEPTKKQKVVEAKDNLKEVKKTTQATKIDAKAEVAEARGNTKRAQRLRDRAERRRTGKTKKEQGRNIFGGKTRKRKKQEAEAAAAAANAEANAPAKVKGYKK